jgi:hypothetical protein
VIKKEKRCKLLSKLTKEAISMDSVDITQVIRNALDTSKPTHGITYMKWTKYLKDQPEEKLTQEINNLSSPVSIKEIKLVINNFAK